MRTGKLRNQAAIQSNAPTRDTIGGEAAVWSDFSNPWWCDIIDVSGGELFRGRVVHAQANYRLEGRYVAGVTAKMRVLFGARVFDIMAVANVDNRGRTLQLDARERNV